MPDSPSDLKPLESDDAPIEGVFDGEPPSSAVVPVVVDPRVIAPAREGKEMATQIKAVIWLKENVMIAGVHYGPPFPGSDKPTLLKPGAELLLSFFGLHPEFEEKTAVREFGRDGSEPLFYYEIRCRVFINGTAIQVGEGGGQASTWESKYRYRKADRICPNCDEPKIIRSKYPDRQTGEIGWYCLACKSKFDYDDPAIVNQKTGLVPNDNIFDVVNTVLKMAEKRAMMQATLVSTGASFVFTQDEQLLEGQFEVIEDIPGGEQMSSAPRVLDNPPEPPAKPKGAPPQKPAAVPDVSDTPWQKYTAHWTEEDWNVYNQRRAARGLTEQEGIDALGCPPKAFEGTVGELKALLDAAEEDKKAPKKNETGKVSMDTERGAFVAARVCARRIVGGFPHVTVWALDDKGREDPLPAISVQVEAAKLRQWIPATPKALSPDGEGSEVYRHDPDAGVTLRVEWERANGEARPVNMHITS